MVVEKFGDIENLSLDDDPAVRRLYTQQGKYVTNGHWAKNGAEDKNSVQGIMCMYVACKIANFPLDLIDVT